MVSAVLSGARVRVVILGSSYSTEADNVQVHGDNVFAQLLQHVSTSGSMQMTRYNMGSNTHRGTNSASMKKSIKWYVQTSGFLLMPSYSHLADGSKVQGSLNNLESSVQNGHEIRCVSSKRYSFPIRNVAINNQGDKFVSGQSLDHISVSSSSNLIQFQSNAYWWFTVVTTRGLRDMSRWTVGTHQSRGHTQDTVGNEWFADDCWKDVFTHDANGVRICGSRQALVSALMSGHRVRFQVPQWNYYTAEADNLSVRNGHVTAQALKHVNRGTKSSQTTNLGMSLLEAEVTWYRLSELEQMCAVCREMKSKAQHLAVSPDGNHVAAQTLNHVSMQSAPNPN
ncbi:hypothetical protein ACROYT_G018657 [Oculina patagonica]